ncbi:DUF4235 domain-containing protein [Bifidobacteriaceae bacterium WP012]|uniref:DUF4235 domain-containing protein n=1 Tax=Gardnerella vaginalis TaxID=2702 RepID=UPI000263408B|nr:DUF4235 domain-containing protein [Gardnerella vaginalis]EIK87194.1 hypothetical protein CGSMWGv6119V5_04506 [Gardnerella vaginalis 6119V5]RIY16501.1 DUF4235 domain-containing protein [Bifidobacteriaceae bacterium WP012]
MTQLSSANNKFARNHRAAQATVQRLNAANHKIDVLRERRLKNPNTLGDSLLKAALPSFATFIAGQIAHVIWKKHVDTKKINLNSNNSSNNLPKEKIEQKQRVKQEEPLLMSIGFAVFSAILTTIVGRLVSSGTLSYIARRQRKRQFRKNKF